MTYDCYCCRHRAADHCRCVYTTCPRCLLCLTHCGCPDRDARRCRPDPDLDDPDGPFGGVAAGVPGGTDSSHALARTPAPDEPLFRLAEAHCLVRKAFTADFLAVAWVHQAPLPDGGWAVQYGGWCQGVGSTDHPWAAYQTRADGVRAFLDAAKGLCTRDVPGGLDRVQETARKRLLAKLTAYERETLRTPSLAGRRTTSSSSSTP